MDSSKRKTQSQEAINRADAQVLKQLYDDAETEVDLLLRSMSVMVDNKKLGPMPDRSVVEAMRDVALAAISLARDVAAEQAKKGTP